MNPDVERLRQRAKEVRQVARDTREEGYRMKLEEIADDLDAAADSIEFDEKASRG